MATDPTRGRGANARPPWGLLWFAVSLCSSACAGTSAPPPSTGGPPDDTGHDAAEAAHDSAGDRTRPTPPPDAAAPDLAADATTQEHAGVAGYVLWAKHWAAAGGLRAP